MCAVDKWIRMNEKSKQKPQMCYIVGCLGLRKVLGFDGGQIFQNLLLPHLTSKT